MAYKDESWWTRARLRRRLTLIDDDTLREFWHIRVSGLGVFTLLFFLLILTIVGMSLLIIYTPFRNILPGYSASLRDDILNERMRVDSLQQQLDLQTRYLGVIHDVIGGDIQSDTVVSLDSMQLIMQQELLQAKSQATADFIAEYEAREKDNLTLFDQPSATPLYSLYAPVHGVITAAFNPAEGRFGVTLQALNKENICATLAGRVADISTDEQTGRSTIVVMHDMYLSIYRNVGRLSCRVGDALQAGQTIAIIADEQPIIFELWQKSSAINPESVIVF